MNPRQCTLVVARAFALPGSFHARVLQNTVLRSLKKPRSFSRTVSAPVEFGRQREANEQLYEESIAGRIAIARLEEQTIPRSYVRISPRSAGRLRIENLTTNRGVRLESGPEIPPSSFRDVELPVIILCGPGKALKAQAIQPEYAAREEFRSLPQMTLAPGSSSLFDTPLPNLMAARAIRWGDRIVELVAGVDGRVSSGRLVV